MKRFLRCTAFLLVVAMLLAMGVACKKKDDGEDADTTTAENVTTTTASGEKPPNDRDDLPDGLDFGGKVFTIYSRVQPYAAGEFFQESRDGGVIAEAVFDRNAKVKERLNCKIENKEVSGNTNDDTMLTEITAMVQGGTAEYQILATAGYRMCTLSYNGLLVNYNDLEYVDLNKDYYSQGYNRALSVGKAQYLATGTFTLGYYRYLMVNLFNKKMFAEKGVEEPYQLVRDQKWTFEAMANIVKLFYNDNNGDGNHDNEDTYGYVLFTGSGSSFTDGFMSACNLRVLSKDSNNYYTIDINQGRFSDAIDEIVRLIFNAGTLSGDNLSQEIMYSKFSNSTAAMITTRLYGVEQEEIIKVGQTDKYGILPIPKMDEAQEDYISYVQDQCFLFGLPVTLGGKTLVEVSQFFEAFACESYHTVRPAYYDKALSLRYSYDAPSGEMLNLIDSHVYMDPVNVYLTSGFAAFTTSSLRPIFASGQNTISSQLASAVNKGALKDQVDKMNEAYEKIYNTQHP